MLPFNRHSRFRFGKLLIGERLVAFVLATVFTVTSNAQDSGDRQPTSEKNQSAVEATQIIRRCCSRCHKGENSTFFDARSVTSMTSEYIQAGDAESSTLYSLMVDGVMPPKNRPGLPRPTEDELKVVKQWIDEGAIEPNETTRSRVDLLTELRGIEGHLSATRDDRSRKNLRFFSIRRVYNDPTVDDLQVRMTRMALAKALNSLSWEPEIVVPQAIDDSGKVIKPGDAGFDQATLYAIDIERLGWGREHWNAILEKYPYAIGYEEFRELHELDQDIRRRRGSNEPYLIDAEWFVAVATKPPVYYSLLFDLEIPSLRNTTDNPANPSNPKAMQDLHLETLLGVDVQQNILQGKAIRSGFVESGVSGQNRMVERHPLPRGGAYWKSYDFLDNNPKAILSQFPLGPDFDRNPFKHLAFKHDGGEIIFSLPNGLQGYMLVDGKGDRIDAGPIEVVGDALKTSGNEQIFAGVSCMACHKSGMIEPPDDEVFKNHAILGEARDFLEDIYRNPKDGELKRASASDSKFFQQALEQAVKDFSGGESSASLPEPVGEVARRYFLDPMTLDTVAAQLDVSTEELVNGIKVNTTLHELGMRVLLEGRDADDGEVKKRGSIKRRAWESPLAFPMMKQVAREFGYSPRN